MGSSNETLTVSLKRFGCVEVTPNPKPSQQELVTCFQRTRVSSILNTSVVETNYALSSVFQRRMMGFKAKMAYLGHTHFRVKSEYRYGTVSYCVVPLMYRMHLGPHVYHAHAEGSN